MFRSLQSRLFLTYLLVAGLVLLFVAVSLLFLLLRSPSGDQRVYLSLERSLPTIARGQGRLLLELEGEELNSTIERMDQMLFRSTQSIRRCVHRLPSKHRTSRGTCSSGDEQDTPLLYFGDEPVGVRVRTSQH